MKLKQWVVAASLAAAGAWAWALPSVQDVESAVKQGQYGQAETMMKEVVEAKPNSARGHYLYAEILAHNARFSQAADEARAAAKIDPAIGFAQPEKFHAFQDLLAREQRAESTRATTPATRTAPSVAAERSTAAPVAPASETAPQRAGVPGWIWIVGLAVIAYALWRGFSRNRAATGAAAPAAYGGAMPGQGVGPAGVYPQNPQNGPVGAPGYGPAPGGYGPGYAPQAGSRGGGMLGTGLAAAGGVAAGMALDRMMHSGEGGRPSNYADGGSGDLGQASTFNNGGGVDNDAARQLEDRNVDFGNGGNDWGGDAGGGGSFDGGGGGSDDGGGGGGWD